MLPYNANGSRVQWYDLFFFFFWGGIFIYFFHKVKYDAYRLSLCLCACSTLFFFFLIYQNTIELEAHFTPKTLRDVLTKISRKSNKVILRIVASYKVILFQNLYISLALNLMCNKNIVRYWKLIECYKKFSFFLMTNIGSHWIIHSEKEFI